MNFWGFGGLSFIMLKTTACLATITIAQVSAVSLSTHAGAISSAEMDLSAETALRSETGYANTVKEAVKAAAVVLIGGCTVF
jgi:hypothetical protein